MWVEDTGIVLRSQAFKERDRLVSILTENNGRISGIAKGAIHSKRFGGAFDLFTCIEFRAKDSPQQNLYRIEEANTRRDFHKLRTSLPNISAAGYFVDLILRMSEERQSARELFLLLAHYLHLLEDREVTHEIVRSFEIKLLDRLGYGPNLIECIGCNLPLDASKGAAPAVDRGGFLCPSCTNGQARLASAETMQWLRVAREILIQNSPMLKFEASRADEGARVLMQFIKYYCPGLGNYEFKSHQLLEQFLNS